MDQPREEYPNSIITIVTYKSKPKSKAKKDDEEEKSDP
jgi:hypothetical protein